MTTRQPRRSLTHLTPRTILAGLVLMAALILPSAAVSAEATEGHFTSVAAGGRHTCGLAQGAAWCWGDNVAGQLGIGDLGRRHVPAAVDTDLRFTSLVAGRAHTCGLTAEGRVHCWGTDDAGQLGDGDRGAVVDGTLVSVASDTPFDVIDAGENHTCGLAGGQVLCWGEGSDGQIGDGGAVDRQLPTPVSLVGTAVALTAAGGHSCAVLADGEALCWGANDHGQLGSGTPGGASTSPAVVSGAMAFAAITAGADHTCGLSAGGAAHCWGRNTYNQMGVSAGPDAAAPGDPVAGSFTSLAAANHRTCGLTSAGEALCWGLEVDGERGDGGAPFEHPAGPTRVTAAGSPFTMVDVGHEHTCGVTTTHETWCWGNNSYGQLGMSHTISQVSPKETDTSGVTMDAPDATEPGDEPAAPIDGDSNVPADAPAEGETVTNDGGTNDGGANDGGTNDGGANDGGTETDETAHAATGETDESDPDAAGQTDQTDPEATGGPDRTDPDEEVAGDAHTSNRSRLMALADHVAELAADADAGASLKRARDAIQKAIDGRWQGDRPDADDGDTVFAAMKKAAKKLDKADVDTDAEQAELATIARALAEQAIGDAQAARATADCDDSDCKKADKELKKALEELQKGDDHEDDADHDTAINRYRKAWAKAAKAMDTLS